MYLCSRVKQWQIRKIMAVAVKSDPAKPKKGKVVKEERKIVDSPLSRMYGLLKGKIFYESDDIFYSYRFNQ